MKEFLKRLKNPTTVIAIVGTAGLLLNQFGINIDLDWLDTTIKLVCSILIAVGIMGNPTTKGLS
ncbi:MAG: hypothetical protein GY787_27510 [Alteromonadales bacterium]|nr:hypothetical protein [Alteromonadales bacterium]